MESIKEEPSKGLSCQIQEKVEERPSSPTDCAICLEQLTDKSFTNSCLHMFCFHCLLAWSKIKPECPLCKQDFYSIIHNIRSMTDYDEYHVPPAEPRLSLFVNPELGREHDFFSDQRRFFSYRTTIMSGAYRLPRGRTADNLLIQPYVDNLEIQADFSRPNSNASSYSRCNRREIYIKELETLPPPSGGRYRECSPNFYRANESQVHRLVRWLQRELLALSQITNRFSAQDLLLIITDMLPFYHINSTPFFNAVNRYLGVHTARFVREFHNFAVSPYELEQYDRDCIYVRQRTGSQLSFIVTVGRDDSEEVQVLPSPSNHSFRPWIDVNDLGRTQQTASSDNMVPQSSSRCFSSASLHSNRQNFNSIPSAHPSSSCVSQTIIDISDSEADDCVIIEQVRPMQETIILDDSDEEQPIPKVLSTLPAQSSLPNSSDVYEILDSSNPVDDEGNSLLDQSLPSTSQECVDLVPLASNSHETIPEVNGYKMECDDKCAVEIPSNKNQQDDSSVLTTDSFSSECTRNKYVSKKLKRKRSKKYYRMKDLKRRHYSIRHEICESSDELVMLTESSSTESDKNDLDWERNRTKRKKKAKKPDNSKRSSKKRKQEIVDSYSKCMKTKVDTTDDEKESRSVDSKESHGKSHSSEAQAVDTHSQVNLPRLRSVVRRIENRSASDRCGCPDFSRYEKNQNEPCTSRGIYDRHRSACRLHSVITIPRSAFSSDSD